MMQVEGGLQGAFETSGGFVLGIFLVRPGAVAAIDGSIPIEENRREGEIVIDLEQAQVQSIGVDNAHADKLVERRREVLLLQEHGGINAGAGYAWNAAQHDE